MASWESGMKVDPVAIASCGVYSETYGVGEEANIANLFGSIGLIEDAPWPVDLIKYLRNEGYMGFHNHMTAVPYV